MAAAADEPVLPAPCNVHEVLASIYPGKIQELMAGVDVPKDIAGIVSGYLQVDTKLSQNVVDAHLYPGTHPEDVLNPMTAALASVMPPDLSDVVLDFVGRCFHAVFDHYIPTSPKDICVMMAYDAHLEPFHNGCATVGMSCTECMLVFNTSSFHCEECGESDGHPHPCQTCMYLDELDFPRERPACVNCGEAATVVGHDKKTELARMLPCFHDTVEGPIWDNTLWKQGCCCWECTCGDPSYFPYGYLKRLPCVCGKGFKQDNAEMDQYQMYYYWDDDGAGAAAADE